MNEISIFTHSLTSDVFLHEELNILSTKFKKINIFSRVDNDKLSSLSLPLNIEVHELNYKESKKKVSLILFLKGLFFEIIHGKYALRYILKPRYYFAYFNNAYSNAQLLYEYLQLKNINQQSIFYSYWFDDWAFQLAILKAEHKINKVITRIHGGDVYEYQHKELDFFFPFRNFQINQIDKIVCISQNGLLHIKQAYKSSSHKLIKNYLGTKDFGLSPLPTDNTTFVIVSCSSFYHFKNVGLIPQILSLLSGNIKWIHIGNEGPELESVLESVKKLPAHITSEFKGQLTSQEVMAFYQNTAVNLFINTSISEGLPVSLMEAISFGIPIMAPNVGGIKEITTDVTGILFELNTPVQQLAISISSIQSETKLFDRKIIRQFWEDNYSAQKNYNHFFEHLNNL